MSSLARVYAGGCCSRAAGWGRQAAGGQQWAVRGVWPPERNAAAPYHQPLWLYCHPLRRRECQQPQGLLGL
jgi:hypothetical protein